MVELSHPNGRAHFPRPVRSVFVFIAGNSATRLRLRGALPPEIADETLEKTGRVPEKRWLAGAFQECRNVWATLPSSYQDEISNIEPDWLVTLLLNLR